MGSPDVLVVGLGAVGSAVAHALSARGCRVRGLDRFAPPHVHGSSHGRTRIIREAYFEAPLYVPLVRRAYDLWDALAIEAGRDLYLQTGALSLGPADRGGLLAGTRASAHLHAIPHEELDAAAIRARFPFLQVPEGATGLFERRAGILFPEACIEAFLSGARARGADIRLDETVLEWSVEGDGVRVQTARETHRAGTLVLAAGAWMPELLARVAPLTVERLATFWFGTPSPEAFAPSRCPVLLWEPEPGGLFYAIPDLGDGFKAAIHHDGETAIPGSVRPPDAEDEAAVRALLRRLIPTADGPVREARTCLYTNTPDRHFLIDRHPEHARVVIASPCSGHGFKFAPAVGELVADLALGRTPAFDLAPFSLARFGPLDAGAGRT